MKTQSTIGQELYQSKAQDKITHRHSEIIVHVTRKLGQLEHMNPVTIKSTGVRASFTSVDTTIDPHRQYNGAKTSKKVLALLPLFSKHQPQRLQTQYCSNVKRKGYFITTFYHMFNH